VLKEIQTKRFGFDGGAGPEVVVGPAAVAKYAVLPTGVN